MTPPQTPISSSGLQRNAPIGVFDSGVGGLTVLDTLLRCFPNERFVYFGDTAMVPYGEKTPEQLTARARQLLAWFTGAHRIKALVVACNTSASSVPKAVFDSILPAITVAPILPACQAIAQHRPNIRHLGILATSGTVRSALYPKTLQLLAPEIEIRQVACPGLVDAIEAGRLHSEDTRDLLEGFLKELADWPVDGLVFGCTHYPHLRDEIAVLLPAGVTFFDPATAMVAALAEALSGMEATERADDPINAAPRVRYTVSSRPEAFLAVARRLPLVSLGLETHQQIHLETLGSVPEETALLEVR
jgi:glutamate racemase